MRLQILKYIGMFIVLGLAGFGAVILIWCLVDEIESPNYKKLYNDFLQEKNTNPVIKFNHFKGLYETAPSKWRIYVNEHITNNLIGAYVGYFKDGSEKKVFFATYKDMKKCEEFKEELQKQHRLDVQLEATEQCVKSWNEDILAWRKEQKAKEGQ